MSSNDVRERVETHVAQFKVGDLINTMIDGAEIDGVIIFIDGHKARIATSWGNFTCDLTLSSKADR